MPTHCISVRTRLSLYVSGPSGAVVVGPKARRNHDHTDRVLISVLSVSQGPIENDVMVHVALIAESQR